MGIRHWAQFYTYLVPRYEVFRYVGKNTDMGLYYFQSIRNKTIIQKGFYQLNTMGFHPFVLDFARVQTYLDSKQEVPK